MESLEPMPSSGDCGVAAERTLPETGTVQFGTEMAAPDFKIENTNWHRSVKLHQECEWKQGESADGFRKDAQFFAPPVGRGSLFSVARPKTFPIRKDKGAGSVDASRWSVVKSVGDTAKNLSSKKRHGVLGVLGASRWSAVKSVGDTTKKQKLTLDRGGPSHGSRDRERFVAPPVRAATVSSL